MAYQASTQEERLRKGPWLEEEDEQLMTFVTLLGERRWDSIAKASGLRRSGKSCRLRWLNYLRPNIKHGDIIEEEEQIILQLHAQWGNRWSRIARMLPGRTDNEIKNYWRSHLRKKVEAQEQDLQTIRNHSEQDFLYKRGDVNGHEHQTEDSRPDEDTSETEKTCYDSQGIANFPFTSSPYETRISDWISELSSDQSEVRYSEDCSSMESLLFNPGWISDDTDTWNCSGSLWDMN